MCDTPGCTGGANPEPGQVFCERCGWPLANGAVEFEQDKLVIAGAITPELSIVVDNTGDGVLKWKFGELPDGLEPRDQTRPVKPGSYQKIPFGIMPDELEVVNDEINLVIRFCDNSGASGDDFRGPGLEKTWRDYPLRIPVEYAARGPVAMPWKTIVFGPNVRTCNPFCENLGDVEIDVRVAVTDDYGVGMNKPDKNTFDLSLKPGKDRNFLVGADNECSGPGELTLTDIETNEVLARCSLIWVEPLARIEAQERYSVGIDLGTTKVAAAVCDQFLSEPEPELVEWKVPQYLEPVYGERCPFAPSDVLIEDEGKTIRFGFDLFEADLEREDLIKQIKTRILCDNAEVDTGVSHIIREVFDKISRQYGMRVFQASEFIFGMPNCSNETKYAEWREKYEKLIVQGGTPFGMEDRRIEFVPESLCAAVDFLHRIQCGDVERNFSLPDGSVICVVDIGASTTDVTIARISFTRDGEMTLQDVKNRGWCIAGRDIDQALKNWALGQWDDRGVLSGSEEDGWQVAERPFPDRKIQEQMKTLKEELYSSVPASREPKEKADWDLAPGDPASALEIDRDLVSRHLADPINRLIHGGDEDPGLSDWLFDIGVPPADVETLCLAGGSSVVDDFRAALEELFCRADVLAFEASARLHVALGAARKPSARAADQLIGDVQLRWGNGQTETVLQANDVPQKVEANNVPIVQPGAQMTCAVIFELEDDKHTLYEETLYNDKRDPHRLQAEVAYMQEGWLKLEFQWLTNPPSAAAPAIRIQRLPSRE